MPDMPKFLGNLNVSIDPETIAAIREAVPQELVQDIVNILLDRNVQRGVMQVQEAVESIQDLSLDMFESIPAAVIGLRGALEAAVEGVQTAAQGVDAQRIADLREHVPAVAIGLARVALARPEAETLRTNVQTYVHTLVGRNAGATPGATTAAVALTVDALTSQFDMSRLGQFGQVADLAFELLLPTPYSAAVNTVIAGLAKANNVDVEYEMAAWKQDLAGKNLITGAVSRYARSHGFSNLPLQQELALKQEMAANMERLFSGVANDWISNGTTGLTVSRATRNANTLVNAINRSAAAATAPAPEAKKTTTRKPRTTKAAAPKAAPKTDKGKDLG